MRENKDLTYNAGTRRRKEFRPAEGRPGAIESGSEDLRRRMFGRLTNAQKRENEDLETERKIKSLPGRIEDLARKLIDIPFNKWTVQDMTDVEKYFTPEQVTWIADVAASRTERKIIR